MKRDNVIEFYKYQALGNDFIILDCRKTKVADPQGTSRIMCRRHFGIGADGLVLAIPHRSNQVRMEFYNPDGSRAEMCGNGIRCLAKYCFEKNIADKTELRIETLAGVKTVWLNVKDGNVRSVTVNMGSPSFERRICLLYTSPSPRD